MCSPGVFGPEPKRCLNKCCFTKGNLPQLEAERVPPCGCLAAPISGWHVLNTQHEVFVAQSSPVVAVSLRSHGALLYQPPGLVEGYKGGQMVPEKRK